MRLWPRSSSACPNHRMPIVAAQPATMPTIPGVYVDATAVLRRCDSCGDTASYLMPGRWSLDLLTGKNTDVERLIAESVKP